jgi:hypothetical protein
MKVFIYREQLPRSSAMRAAHAIPALYASAAGTGGAAPRGHRMGD